MSNSDNNDGGDDSGGGSDSTEVLKALRAWFQTSGMPEVLDAQEDAPWDQSGDGWTGGMTCGACPVQIEGEVDGMRFYFRARHGEWSMGFATTPERAIRCRHGFVETGEWTREGDDTEEGFMKHSEAWRIVRESIEQWRAWRAENQGEVKA